MSRAFIFPGQGSQIVGMGREFYDNFSTAKECFQEVDEILNRNLSKIIFEGPAEELTLTTNAQPAIMAVSIAILRTLLKQSSKKIQELCNYAAGHSLGEYTALCAAESLTLQDVGKLLDVRSSSMQSACHPDIGAMAACIGIDIQELENILQDLPGQGSCEIANDNIVGQIVISGHREKVALIVGKLNSLGYKAIPLKVSAPFHSSLMKEAEKPMTDAVHATLFTPPIIPVIQNIVASPVTGITQIKNNLILQICGRVRWRETLDQLNGLGVQEYIEIGPGRVLSNMCKKHTPTNLIANISTIQELDSALAILG